MESAGSSARRPLPELLHTGVPRRVLLQGLLGTVLLAISGPGAGAVPRYRDAVATFLHVAWIHPHRTLHVLSIFVALGGIVLLASAWWQLRALLPGLLPRSILVVAAVWALPLLLTTPLFSRDVYAYAGQGHVVASGIDPYTYGPNALSDKWRDNVDGIWLDTPSPYGPVWLWIAGRVVALSGDHVVPAIFLLRLLAVLGMVLIAWTLPKLARDHGVPAQRALWLGVANPFVLIHTVGGAHNDSLMVGLLVCGLAVAGRDPTPRRLLAAAALITLAALIKVPAIAALGFLPMAVPAWRARIRAAVLVAVATAATAVFATALTGLGWGWLHTLDGGTKRLSIFSPLTGIGVLTGHALEWVGLVQTPDVATRWVIVSGLAVAGAVAIVLLLRSSRIGPLRALGLTMVAVVALAPIVQPWYLLWGLVLLAAVGGERVTLALGALSVALCLSVLPDGRSLIRPPLYGAPLLAAAGLAAVEVRRSARMVLDPERQPAPAPSV
jgi:alpha-1,6-mannosyltransferase